MTSRQAGKPRRIIQVMFFSSQSAFRRWLENHHDRVRELWVGFYRRESGKGGITYCDALDEALCFGWIDGLRKMVDDSSYTIRFTPRRADSIWSEINIKRVDELTKLGRMQKPGLAAFKARDQEKTRQYSYERNNCRFEPERRKSLKRTLRLGSSFALKQRSISGRRLRGW